MLLLYKNDPKPHVYWAGGVHGVPACMANTIIP